MANKLEIKHIWDARVRALKERTATKTRISSFLDSLAKFRNVNSVQIVIEFLQILGIGIWIWTDISPDLGMAPPPPNSWFQIPDGPKILLGLFSRSVLFSYWTQRLEPGLKMSGMLSLVLKQRARTPADQWLPKRLIQNAVILKTFGIPWES